MNKKHTFKKTTALLLGIALSVGATGCSFITTDNQKDLQQTVATVNISGQLSDEYKDVAKDVEAVLAYISKDIMKRDLISSYLSTGYQYVESYGYTYEATFNMLLDGLVSREIMIQNAVAYYLKNTGATAAACEQYIDAEIEKVENTKEKELLTAHKDVLALKYFLSIDDAEMKDYNTAVYTLKKSLNSSLDSLEASYITAESEEHDHAEARTLPTGVDTEKEDYFTANYEVYTGRNDVKNCGEYKAVDGSTVNSRKKAYNAFLTNLQAYSLISKEEDTQDVTKLDYYYVELASILSQSLINKYYESLRGEVSDKLSKEYMEQKYEELRAQNEQSYANDSTAFSSALDGAAEGNFLLYGLENFGYVYNILIPFSTSQSVRYTEAKNRGLSEEQLFAERRAILTEVEGKDLRDTWFSEHEHANYSYEKDGKYYFFEDNFNGTQYEELSHYAGNYAFNGTVEMVDGEYEVKANPVDIDEFIEIFEGYIEETSGVAVKQSSYNPYYANEDTLGFKNKETGKVNYEKFTYYAGMLDFTDEQKASADYFNKESAQYKALSAVNELLFAYGTDPGALNSYMGYAVSPYTTNFVKEFEYAGQAVVEAGVGSYAVCATDYGWHILYCSFKYDGGDVYGGYIDADKEVEGTFSNMFYEYIKEAAYTNHATEVQNRVLLEFNNENTVTRFEKAYKDLLEMDLK